MDYISFVWPGFSNRSPGAEVLLQWVVQATGRQLHPYSPWRSTGEQRFSCSPWRTRVDACPKEAVILWEAHAGADSWKDLWTHGKRSSCWSKFSGKACDPARDPCWTSLFLRDYTPWKGPTLEQLIEIYIHSFI